MEPSYQLAIAGEKWPSYPCRGVREAYFRLRESMCTQGSHLHNYSMSLARFKSDSLILGIDCEKDCPASYTGVNCRAGQHVFWTTTNMGTSGEAAETPTNAYLTLVADVQCVRSDSGIQLVE